MEVVKIRPLGIVLGIFLVAQSAYSVDVAYQVDTERLSPTEPTKTSEPAAIAIVDREWCVPGVEESISKNGLVVRHWHKSSLPVKAVPGTVTQLPEWICEVTWPLTRDLWNRVEWEPCPPIHVKDFDRIPRRHRGFDGMPLATQR